MADRWIVDASPVIALAKIGHASLLETLPDELFIPEAVASEILDGPADDPARLLIESGFGNSIASPTIPERLLAWSLGPGESEVLALALQDETERVVIDDAAARRCAATLGIPMTGTLGVLLRAKRAGQIESVASMFRALQAAGLYIDDRTARTLLTRLGEKW